MPSKKAMPRIKKQALSRHFSKHITAFYKANQPLQTTKNVSENKEKEARVKILDFFLYLCSLKPHTSNEKSQIHKTLGHKYFHGA